MVLNLYPILRRPNQNCLNQVESDPLGEFQGCRQVWAGLGLSQSSDEDCFILRCVCEAASRRCSLLLAAGIAALLKKMGERDVTIAVDGSLFRSYVMQIADFLIGECRGL